MKKKRLPAPGVLRKRIAGALKEARTTAGKKQEEAAKYLEVAKITIIRMEQTGRIRAVELEALLRFYGLEADRISNLLSIHELSNRKSPYADFQGVDGVDESYLVFLQHELSADLILNFEPMLVPGLLQIESYARAVVEAVERHPTETVDTLVDLRVYRQQLVSGSDPEPDRHFILDEAVLRRLVGGPAVMIKQLEELNRVALEDSAVTLQVVPSARGLYRHFRIPYVLLELPGPDLESDLEVSPELVLYIEDPLGQLVVHEGGTAGRPSITRGSDAQDPTEYRTAFSDMAETVAGTVDESVHLLEAALADLRRAH